MWMRFSAHTGGFLLRVATRWSVLCDTTARGQLGKNPKGGRRLKFSGNVPTRDLDTFLLAGAIRGAASAGRADLIADSPRRPQQHNLSWTGCSSFGQC